ncbi:acyl-CoA thioesterase [Pseudomonas alkylphenolica]|uniref:Acyl-CoA thioesterase n=1 Tax=Pseudomonas alkylphenolica TaxID=237609 RepID=A0A6I6HB58_9PSED|nr:thioesterase family protein [Pseudomonas alkylphenolica]QGW78198.1 acyl-CoA thioesterase [Pseudomonas alkylphenolica]
MPNSVIVKRKVLFGDCDPEGIVYTPRFSYFVIEAVHDALSVWLSGPGLRTLLGFDLLPPARAFSLEFLHPLTWDDELSMTVSVSSVSLHSFTFLVEGNVAPDIKAFTASLTHVCVSPVTRKIIEVPQALRALLVPDECGQSGALTAGG